MKYKAKLKAFGDSEKILRCFEAEGERQQDRSTLKMSKMEDYVLFEVTAKDATALRATLNGITKLLSVYEKMESIKNG